MVTVSKTKRQIASAGGDVRDRVAPVVRERVAPAVESVGAVLGDASERLGPALDIAKERIAPALGGAKDKLAPALDSAKDKIAPVARHAVPRRRRQSRFTLRTALIVLALAGIGALVYKRLVGTKETWQDAGDSAPTFQAPADSAGDVGSDSADSPPAASA